MTVIKQTLMQLVLVALTINCCSTHAETIAYGAPISLELAKKVAQAASTEMHKKHLELTIAVVDSGGNLIYLERSNQAPIGTVDAAIGKAKAANGIKAPTKALEDQILNNNKINLLGIPGAFPVEGGVPLIANQKIIGAIGASGATPSDDGAVANAGAKSLQP
ncbi:GlcG/HbpS family heme-binding protein [Undibacterium sp. Xuan67W]|uniref:GlcG/HbpS family heme-binding protein n=1 Tax=Undibacterium sp. Xuan67W TaxID=3413057 RepID=UPI003BF2063E